MRVKLRGAYFVVSVFGFVISDLQVNKVAFILPNNNPTILFNILKPPSTRSCHWAQCPGEGVLPYMGYMGMCRCEGYGFQVVYSRIYKSERLGLE